MLKSDSRSRSAVGRIDCDCGAASTRPPSRPPTMRIQRPRGGLGRDGRGPLPRSRTGRRGRFGRGGPGGPWTARLGGLVCALDGTAGTAGTGGHGPAPLRDGGSTRSRSFVPNRSTRRRRPLRSVRRPARRSGRGSHRAAVDLAPRSRDNRAATAHHPRATHGRDGAGREVSRGLGVRPFARACRGARPHRRSAQSQPASGRRGRSPERRSRSCAAVSTSAIAPSARSPSPNGPKATRIRRFT